ALPSYWPEAPAVLEDKYTVADAVVVGNLLISLLRHTDRVHAASLAQLVNVIAPIVTEPGGGSWQQTIFHPFALTAAHARGQVLDVATDVPQYATAKFGPVPLVDAVATHDEDAGTVTVFAVNRSTTAPVDLQAATRGLPALQVVEARTPAAADPYRTAGPGEDSSVAPHPTTTATADGGHMRIQLPPVSWSMVRLSVQYSARR